MLSLLSLLVATRPALAACDSQPLGNFLTASCHHDCPEDSATQFTRCCCSPRSAATIAPNRPAPSLAPIQIAYPLDADAIPKAGYHCELKSLAPPAPPPDLLCTLQI